MPLFQVMLLTPHWQSMDCVEGDGCDGYCSMCTCTHGYITVQYAKSFGLPLHWPIQVLVCLLRLHICCIQSPRHISEWSCQPESGV